jgi:hypothetical protein
MGQIQAVIQEVGDMSRSGYSVDNDNNWGLICWRGQVASAIRGQRGQQLLVDLVKALDAMPQKQLIAHELVKDGEVCALGAVGKARGLPIDDLDPEDPSTICAAFNIAEQLAREITWVNDEAGPWPGETPEQRWGRVRAWAVALIQPVDLVDIPDLPPPNTGET